MMMAANVPCVKAETPRLEIGVESDIEEWIDSASIEGGQEHGSTVTQGLDPPQAAVVQESRRAQADGVEHCAGRTRCLPFSTDLLHYYPSSRSFATS